MTRKHDPTVNMCILNFSGSRTSMKKRTLLSWFIIFSCVFVFHFVHWLLSKEYCTKKTKY